MYKLKIVYQNDVIFSKCFFKQKDIIQFTNGRISYNDFKPRTHPKKYRTYKDYYQIERI